ncbi:MAG: hypothetical protein K6B43_08100 [Treponema sp.]|nr:hypothetical protein [Treponema sp.]
MRSRIHKITNTSVSYDLSISDLMSALCCIFLLFLSVTVLEFNTKKNEYEVTTGQYRDMQKELKREIDKEFDEDFKKWNAYVSDDLTIHFQDQSLMFKDFDDELTQNFKDILTDLFPRLILILSNERFYEKILEIRIEGHTAEEKNKTKKVDYQEGIDLSQRRTKNVLFYCLDKIEDRADLFDEQLIEWVRQNTIAVGYSNSLPIYDEEGNKDANLSRRVEIKLRTKPEEVSSELKNIK